MAKQKKAAAEAADPIGDDNLEQEAATATMQAEAPTETKRTRKPKQERLPGMEEPHIAELDDAAEDYASVRDERMELTKREVEKQAKLIELMHKHQLSTYKFDGYIVELDIKEKAKVKRDKDEDDTDADDDEE